MVGSKALWVVKCILFGITVYNTLTRLTGMADVKRNMEESNVRRKLNGSILKMGEA